MAETAVRLSGVSKSFGGKVLLNRVDLEIAAGESVAIVGKSGSGKSTLLSILGLIDVPDSGHHEFDGTDVSTMSTKTKDALRGSEIGFIFQRFALFPHLNALENVLVPLRHAGFKSNREMRDLGMQMLGEVGLTEAAHRRPARLSGGEQQRVAIARALVRSPRLILADEPTGSLDVQTGSDVASLLIDQVRQRGASLVVVTHDPDIAARLSAQFELTDGALRPRPQLPARGKP